MIPAETVLEETRRTLSRLRPAEAAWWTWVRENLFRPLGRAIEKAADVLAAMAGTLGGQVLLAVLAAAALVLVVFLFLHLYRSRQEGARSRSADRVARGSPVLRDPDEAERDAARLATEGRFTEAVRLLYLSTFVRLHRRSGRRFDPSLTPGENLGPFRGEPWFPGLRGFVAGYQAASFGDARLDEAGYRAIRELRPPEGRA